MDNLERLAEEAARGANPPRDPEVLPVPPGVMNIIENQGSRYHPDGGPPRDPPQGNNDPNRTPRSRSGNGNHGEEASTPPVESKPESKYSILDEISQQEKELVTYVPSPGEGTFTKQKWSYAGEYPFELFLIKLGSMARALNITDICYKTALFHAIQPPCSVMIQDMEPSLHPFNLMNRKEYTKSIHDRLEPNEARDLIYTQYISRVQKPEEVFDLYLRDKYSLFTRSFPEGKVRIFKDFMESTIRGLANDLLRTKVRDFLSMKSLSNIKVETFEEFRRIVQISVENLQCRAQAGDLDPQEIRGTNVALMNFSYLPEKGNSESKRQNRYSVNHTRTEMSDMDTINEFKAFKNAQFQQFKAGMKPSASKTPRMATESDMCYHCEQYGHFAKFCPRRNFPPTRQKARINELSYPNHPEGTSEEDSSPLSEDEETEMINYFKNRNRKPNTKPQKRGKSRENIHNIIKQQDEKINQLTDQISSLANSLNKAQNAGKVNSVNGTNPTDSEDPDIFHFLGV